MKVIRYWFSSLIFFSMLFSVSCGGDELGVSNVSPMGSIGGVVLDLATGLPLEGVAIEVVAGGKIFPEENKAQIVTDASGRFAIENVPAGDVIIQMSKADYITARFDDVLDDSAGEFPRSNATLSVGPVGLVPVVAEADAFKIQLVFEDGSAASNVTVNARTSFSWALYNDELPQGKGILGVNLVSGATGIVALKGLPDYAKLAGLMGLTGLSDLVRITVAPIDADHNGVYESLGLARNLNINSESNVPVLVIPQQGDSLAIVATNIPALDGKEGNKVLPAAGPLTITFSQTIDGSLTEATLRDEGGALVTDPVSISANGTLLSLGFSGLNAGQEYNLNLTVVTTEGVTKSYAAPFFIKPDPNVKIVPDMKAHETDASRVIVTFSEVIGTGTVENLYGVFYDFDFNNSGVVGDASGELGSLTTSYYLKNAEVDPTGPVGKSGYTRNYELQLPSVGGQPLPAGTQVVFDFSVSAKPVTRISGETVPEITTLVPSS